MRNRSSIAMSALTLLCALLGARITWAGESAHQFSPTLYWFCQSSTVPPAYLSAVVVTTASGTTNESLLPQLAATKRDIEQSFADFLAKQQGYTGLSSCISNESRVWIESNRNQRIETLRTRGLEIVETGWTYARAHNATPLGTASQPVAAPPATQRPPAVSPATPAAPAAATPAKPAVPSAPAKPATGADVVPAQAPWAFCFGEVRGLNQTVYFGVPFNARAKDIPAWSTAYKEFLRDKYKFAGLIHCRTQNSQAEASRQAQRVEDRYREHWMVVETGWKYQ